MKIEVLGSGTSQGIPVIGCSCEVCTSSDPRDKRLRCAIWVRYQNLSFVIDIGPDFRAQMLRSKVDHMDALIITHEHNDHVIGIDDVRPFNFKQRMDIPVFAEAHVQEKLKQRFEYAFHTNPYPGAPRLLLKDITASETFQLGSLEIIPIQVFHGKMPVLGFRIGDFTYITDANRIDEEERVKIRGSKYLIINALHHEPHHAHFNLNQALEVIADLKVEKAFISHISHRMGRYAKVNATLPQNVELAFDGLQLTLPD